MTRAAAFASALVVLGLVACSSSFSDDVVVSTRDGGLAFSAPDAAEAAPTLAELCAATECRLPYATCPTSRYLCDIDLENDPKNCGSCGTECAPGAGCGFGRCVVSCPAGRADCDGIIDNGCETELGHQENCGKCGDVCSSDQGCFEYKCGPGFLQCPPPEVRCANPDGDVCADLQKDATNCGTCDHVCPRRPAGAPAPPPHMHFGCASGTCGALVCDDSWVDCNGDQTDGCEVNADTMRTPDRCGGCNVKCAPGQLCAFLADGPGTFQCLCGPGQTACHDLTADDTLTYLCALTDTDPNNCGACNRQCPDLRFDTGAPGDVAIAATMQVSCNKGVCGTACVYGRGDCNGIREDGCEGDLMHDSRNCGACGNECPGAGQSCVNGTCLMVPCPPGETR